jgi:fumarate reductase subunit D
MAEIVKDLFGRVVFWVCLIVSLILIVLGFVVPPMGTIDPSVLTAVGEIFGFATLGVVADAIKEGYDAKIKKGEMEINITNDKN